MDIKIITDKNELKGSCYIEILPGSYNGVCWNDASIFFDEEVFGLLEPTIAKHAPTYDHYAFTEIDKSTWFKIILDMKNIQFSLNSYNSPEEIKHHFGFIFKKTEDKFLKHFEANKKDVSLLLSNFTIWLKKQLSDNNVLTVLGI